MRISCIAIDDEPLALTKLETFINRMPELQLLKTFGNAMDALGWIRQNQVELIFLDIQMEQLTGIEFLEAASPDPAVIITSAYEQYALKGYELNVRDYLLKPYSYERFVKAVNKVLEEVSEKGKAKSGVENNRYIFVKTEYRLERVDTEAILYIEGMKDYLRIICPNKKIMTLLNFTRMEEILPPGKFCRIHKSYLVALSKIDSVERGIVIIAGQRIPVSNTYKEAFFRQINWPSV